MWRLIVDYTRPTHLQQFIPRDFVIPVQVIQAECDWKMNQKVKLTLKMKSCKYEGDRFHTHTAACLPCC